MDNGRKKREWLKAFLRRAAACLLVAAQTYSVVPTADVPKACARLYQEFDRILDAHIAALDVPSAGAIQFKPLSSVDLLAANSDHGRYFLRPDTMETVRLSLDHFKAMGIQCVTFDVQYPLLRPDFPQAADYLDFYRAVVQKARAGIPPTKRQIKNKASC
jgi:hypothetical protein